MIQCFVYGSNLSGVHGAGSARAAWESHGAIWGNGVGYSGNSYGIPTKDRNIEPMTIAEIKPYIDDFVKFATKHPGTEFNIVAIGCGLAGFTPEQIAPMFREVPENCNLPEEFKQILEANHVS